MLPNGQWVPVDVTAADAMDWSWTMSSAMRTECKDYYFGDLDSMRFIIQDNVDENLTPQPRTSMPISAAFQDPGITCSGSNQDLSLLAMGGEWNFTITKAS